MKPSKLIIILGVLSFLLITGCGTATNNDNLSAETVSKRLPSQPSTAPTVENLDVNIPKIDSVDEQIIEVFKRQVHFANQEDLNGYMSTIYDDSHLADGIYTFIANETQKQFQKYDAKLELLNVSDISLINKEEAKANYTYSMTFIEQGKQITSTTTSVAKLKIQNNEWKLVETEILKITYTDENGKVFEPDTVNAMKLAFYKLGVPSLDEENGNSPGQELPKTSEKFISKHLSLFPATTKDTFQEVISLANDTIQFREISKNISKFNDTIISGVGYIYDIHEYDTETELGMLTEMYVETDDTNHYEGYQIFILGTVDAYVNDSIRFYGLPVIMSGYENVDGGYTNVALLVGSYIEVIQ